MNHVLYGIIYNTTGEIVYYGITSNFEARVSSHFATSSWNNPNGPQWNKPLYRAFRKHGVENFSIHILKTYPTREEVAAREAELVPRNNKEVWPRYNAYPGGDATEVWAMNIFTKEVGVFDRAIEASEVLGITPQYLNTLLNENKQYQTGGYVVSYREKDLEQKYKKAWLKGKLGIKIKVLSTNESYSFVDIDAEEEEGYFYLPQTKIFSIPEEVRKIRENKTKAVLVDRETGEFFVGRNMAEIGRSIGVSRERVRQLLKEPTKKYRPADDIETVLLSFRA